MINYLKKIKKKYYALLLLFLLILFLPSKTIKNNSIAVINIEGVILESKKIVKALDKFSKDDNIKAIVLRINSPGGSVAPSQEIFHKVNNIKSSKVKPIITSVGNVAASGGYYIAIGSDVIVANSGSIVGSIGVIMSYPIAEKFLDNIGINFNTYKSGEFKDSGSPYRQNTESDDEYFNEVVSDLHAQFTKEVSVHRNIDLKYLNNYSKGQIFTGNKAYSIGLIDTVGTFEDALNISKNLANISGDLDIVYPDYEKYSFLNEFISFYNLTFKNYLLPMFLMN